VQVTIVWSTAIAVAAYLLKNEVFDPLRGFRSARWRAATVLVVHENVLANSGMSTPGAKDDVRRLAAELKAAYMQVPFRGLLGALWIIQSGQAVGKSVALLIGVSNGNDGSENSSRIRGIRSALEIV
jgi:hypothetical protein